MRVSQGREFLNFVENTPTFRERAAKLRVKVTIIKDSTVMIMLCNAGFIGNDFLAGTDTLATGISEYLAAEVERLL